MAFFYELSLLVSGLLLAIAKLDQWDGDTDIFNKLSKFLTPAKSVFGLGALILGFIYLLRPGCLIYDIAGILAGLLLMSDVILRYTNKSETIGNVIKKLTPYKIIIGLLAFFCGISLLLNFNLFC